MWSGEWGEKVPLGTAVTVGPWTPVVEVGGGLAATVLKLLFCGSMVRDPRLLKLSTAAATVSGFPTGFTVIPPL